MATATIDTEKRKALIKVCKVTTGLGIISYAFIWEPRAEEDGKVPKYSVSFLIPKSDVKTLTNIKNAINAAATLGQADKWNGKLPDPLKHPLRDGDKEADEKGEEYRGHYFFNATSTRKPRIVDFNIQDIVDQDEVYSGCKCRISCNFYAFNTNGNKGVACGLNHVQKIEDGDPLGGSRSNAEEDFADSSDLDLPFGEDDIQAPAKSAAPVKQAADDILAGIDFAA